MLKILHGSVMHVTKVESRVYIQDVVSDGELIES